MKRNAVVGVVFGLLTFAAVNPHVAAQAFPTRPVNMVVPYAAGGSADVVGRLVGAEMAKTLGHNVVIELKPGAGGNIGAELVARNARADGYTMLLGSLSLSSNVSRAYPALFAPASTPQEAIARLEDAAAKAIQVPAVKERLTQMGAESLPVAAAEFQKYFNDDVERFTRLVREGKIKPLQ